MNRFGALFSRGNIIASSTGIGAMLGNSYITVRSDLDKTHPYIGSFIGGATSGAVGGIIGYCFAAYPVTLITAGVTGLMSVIEYHNKEKMQ